MENNKIITAFCLLKFSVHVTLNKSLISNNLINKTCILLTNWMRNQKHRNKHTYSTSLKQFRHISILKTLIYAKS